MMASLKYTVFLATCCLAVSLICLSANIVLANYYMDLEGISFSVSSRVRTSVDGGNLRMDGEFFEMYSTEQQRAIVQFKLNSERANGQNDAKNGRWFVDIEQKLFLELDTDNSKCSKTSIQDIDHSFNFYVPKIGEDPYKRYKDDAKSVPNDHIIGPARLMLFFEKHRDNMILLVTRKKIRNIQCVVFELDHTTEDGERIELLAYYSEISLGNPIRAHPIQIVMNRAGKQTMSIDYAQIQLVDQVLPQMEINHLGAKSVSMFDEFVFEPLGLCSEARASNEIDLFVNQTQTHTIKFSFKANLEIEGNDGADDVQGATNISATAFVAYDAALKSMRTDILQKDNVQVPSPGVERQIFNFQLNCRYHIRQREQYFHTMSIQVGADDNDDGNYNSANGGNTECIVAKLREPLDRETMTVGKLLAGADKFIYLGRAEVRGMAARVYESSQGSLPFWLDQPVVFKDKAGYTGMRKSEEGLINGYGKQRNNNDDVRRNILLFFGEKDASQPLLLIEIYDIEKEGEVVLSRKSIQIYDFAWNLIESSEGDRGTELFSLEDSCTDSKGARAKFEMLLESDEMLKPITDDLPVFSSNSRNLALLGSLQEKFFLPVIMMSDLETKLIRVTKSEKQSKNFLKMVTSFSVAEHSRKIAELYYYGKGLLKGLRASKFVLSFQDCFFLGAHKRLSIFFGYDNEMKHCYIDYTPVRGHLNLKEQPKAFSIDDKGSLEIYRTTHSLDPRQSKYSYWIRESPAEKTGILGSRIKMQELRGPSDDMFFTIRSVQKEYYNPSAAAAASATADSANYTVNEITGFGLLESDDGNKRVKPASIISSNISPLSHELEDENAAMSFEQCHATCLSDTDCQSFSVCVRNSEVECVISKISFKSAIVFEQLENFTKTTAPGKRISGIVKITLDDGQKSVVELARHPNCELRNKNFLELFNKQSGLRQTLRNRRARAVSGRAECAEKCFRQNLKVLKQDVGKMSKVFLSFSKQDKLISPKEFQVLLTNHSQATRQLCDKFYYLDRELLKRNGKDFEPELKELLLVDKDSVNMDKVGGFCLELLDKTTNNPALFKEELYNVSFRVEAYNFKTDTFYEKQYGIGLRGSPLSELEFNAYREVKRKRSGAQESAHLRLRSLIEMGYNFQELIFINPTDCAHACFRQTTDLWPACRSFDIFHVGRQIWCVFNSVTLHQVKSKKMTELISNPKDTHVWHYEPRAGFIMDESILGGKLDLTEDSLIGQLHAKSLAFRIHFFGSFLVVLLGLTSGLVLGLWLVKRISNNPRSNTNDVRGLVEPTSVAYSNQVNSDGEVVFEWSEPTDD